MDNQVQNDEFGSTVFEQFMELFVMPEIERRQGTGELEKPPKSAVS